MTRTTPLRRMILHLAHIRLTDARTFMGSRLRVQGLRKCPCSRGRIIPHSPRGNASTEAGDQRVPALTDDQLRSCAATAQATGVDLVCTGTESVAWFVHETYYLT